MENRTLVYTFLVTWAGYFLVAHVWAWRKRIPIGTVIASHAVSSAVAGVMTYVFVIAGGATVAQFVSESESGMDLWRLWVHLWPVLLLSAALSAAVGLVWTIIACVKSSQRRLLPLAIGSFGLSVIAFFTVGANFPDA
jgi:hypothetical protein